MIRSVFVLAGMFVPALVLALGETTVTGVVRASDRPGGLSKAGVAVVRAADSVVVRGTLTQPNGAFSMQLGSGPSALLRVSYASYETVFLPLTIDSLRSTGDTVDVGTVVLQPRTGAEVAVVADRSLVEYRDGKKVFNVTESITTAAGNALDVLRQVPTVNVDLDGNVTVNGLAGVNIMIENKPISAYGNPAQILKTLPAAALDKVEVIATPGAKYDAQGEGGILNLVLRRERGGGLNGIVDLNVGLHDNYSGAAMLNQRTETLHLTAGADFVAARQQRYREVETDFDGTSQLFRTGSTTSKARSIAGRVGADITLDTVQRVALNAEVRHNNGTGADPWNNTFVTSAGSSYQYMDQTTGGPTTAAGVTGTYTRAVGPKDQDLVANVYFYPDWFDVTTTVLSTPTTQSGTPSGTTTGQRARTVGTGRYIEGMVDYGMPLSETMRMETGVDATIQLINSSFEVSDYDALTDGWTPNSALSNGAWHREDVYAVYANLAESFDALSLSGGIRWEQTYNWFENRDDASINFHRTFGNMFPSLSVSYKLTDATDLQLSYARRINRPTGPQLNPYIDRTDSLNWRSGNPALLPEYTNAYRVGVLQTIDQSMLNVEAFVRQTTNAIQQRYREEVAPGVILERPYNFGNVINTGISGTAHVVLAPWLNMNTELSYFYQYAGGEFNGQTVDSEGYGWNGRLIVNASLPLAIKGQAFLEYTAPQVIPQGTRRQYSIVSLAMNREFKEEHLTVGFNWSDIFNTAIFGGTVSGDGFSSSILNRRDFPLVSLTVSYRINDYQGQRPRSSPGGVGVPANTI